MEVTIARKPENKQLYAQRFALWVAIATMVMTFAGFTSAYIVKKGDAETWTNFSLPDIFFASTAMILLSSVTMHLGMRSFKRNSMVAYRNWMLGTFLLGVGFIIAQIIGWQSLVNRGFALTEEVSADFLYVISGAHAVHVLAGVLVVLAALAGIQRKLRQGSANLTQDFIGEKRKFRVELTATFWHFVDALWLYLFLFLMYNHS